MAHLNTPLLNLAVVANDVDNNKKRKNVDTPTTKAQKKKKRKECLDCLLRFSHAQTVAIDLTGFLSSEGVPLEVIRASAAINHFLAKSVKTLAVIAAASAAAEAADETAAEAAADETAAEAAADETAADKTAADVAVDEAVVC